MIIFLALVLIILMILIGGERGAVSLMTLAGNIVILFISILLMSIGFPALLLILAAGAGVCYNSLFYQNGNNPKTRAAFLATLDIIRGCRLIPHFDKSYNSFFGLRRNTETSQAAVYTPLSRDIQAKIPLPQANWNEFWLCY